MKELLWLLDLNQQIYRGKSSIWMWGIGQDGRRMLVIDTHFQPYFYLEPPHGIEIEDLRDKILKEKPHPTIDSAIVVRRLILNQRRDLIKVYCTDPFSVEKAAKVTLKKMGAANIYEADLRQATKYQNEYQIVPCKWYKIDIQNQQEDPSKYSVDFVGATTTPPTPISALEEIPSLRFLAFQILVAGQFGLPTSRRDPIRAIAFATNNGTQEVLKNDDATDDTLLREFVKRLDEENPDVILTFDGNTVQWPYLEKRAEETNVSLKVGRQQGIPHQSLYGHYSVTGRANVDLADFARFLYDIKNKTLHNLASYFGIASGNTGQIKEIEYFETLSNPNRKQILYHQLIEDAITLLAIGREALHYVTQIATVSGLPPDQAIAAGMGFRVDSYLMMEAHALGMVIPTRVEQYAATYKGALVIEPNSGLFENVALLDFSSMYPNLMIKYNISPDTFVPSDTEILSETYRVPEVYHRFRLSPPGFYKIALTKLLEARMITKSQLKQAHSSDSKYKILRARDMAIKVTTNAIYGYAGWAGARWYSREVAESAAALGRATISESISIAERLGLEVLYSDTDSLFVKNDTVRIAAFLTKIHDTLGLEINISEIYKKILFTEAKKKYAGLREDGGIDIVGLEAIRGDWSMLAKSVQNQVLRIILEKGDESEAVEYVSQLIRKLKTTDDEITLASLVIWKTLTRPVAKYEVNAPHVEAARKMVKDGWPISVGDKIGFIITKRPGKLYQKAEPYYKVRPEEVDYDYYIRNQIIPATARITEIFGVTVERLMESVGEKQESLSTIRSEGP